MKWVYLQWPFALVTVFDNGIRHEVYLLASIIMVSVYSARTSIKSKTHIRRRSLCQNQVKLLGEDWD